ncbi:MAG: hypothetical protein ACFFCW_23915 [Candidatus Hodarchaeota archaeon]
MKILYCFIIALLLAANVHAAEIFMDKELNEIYVAEIVDGVAHVQSTDGMTAEIVLGDILSIAAGVVVEIESTYITVEIAKSRIKMPAVYGSFQ